VSSTDDTAKINHVDTDELYRINATLHESIRAAADENKSAGRLLVTEEQMQQQHMPAGPVEMDEQEPRQEQMDESVDNDVAAAAAPAAAAPAAAAPAAAALAPVGL